MADILKLRHIPANRINKKSIKCSEAMIPLMIKGMVIPATKLSEREREGGFCPSFYIRDLVDFIAGLSRLPSEELLKIFWEFWDSALARNSELWSHQLDTIVACDFKDNTFKAFEITEELLRIDNSLENKRILWGAWYIQTGAFSPLEDGSTPKLRRAIEYVERIRSKMNESVCPSFWSDLKNSAQDMQRQEIESHRKRMEQLEEGDHGF